MENKGRALLFCAVAALLLLLSAARYREGVRREKEVRAGEKEAAEADHSTQHGKRGPVAVVSGTAPLSAEEKVAGLVKQFARSRREIALKMGRSAGALPPPEVEALFAALEAGDWKEVQRLWSELRERSGQYDGSKHDPALDPFWPALLDAYGVAEQAQMWPAERLLQYGEEIMKALKPGAVYVGGTDPGRWIPTMLNEGKGNEQHVILTQNALADSRYIDYLGELYADRMQTISQDEAKRIIEEYKEDAGRRFEHDQRFPNEPKQVKPGETVKIVDGKVELSGQPAVRAINERLLNFLMERNPEMTFAIEQSAPFESTYADAAPAGPIMELGVREEDRPLTEERALDTVAYWREVSAELSPARGPELSSHLRLAYGKLAANQAALFANRNFDAAAEQTYRLALEMSPNNPEAVFGYANLLSRQNRGREAMPYIERAAQADPERPAFRDLLERMRR